MTIDPADAMAWKQAHQLTKEFNGSDGPLDSTTERGTPYVTITHRGVKPEGVAHEPVSQYTTAVKRWHANVREYMLNHPNCRLVWRIRPQIERVDDGFQVYSRLAAEPVKEVA